MGALLVLLVAALCAASLVVRVSRVISGFGRVFASLKSSMVVLLFLGYFACLILGGVTNSARAILAGVLFSCVANLIVYEKLTYIEYSLVDLKERLPQLARGMYAYLFMPEKGVTAAGLLNILWPGQRKY